MTHLEAVGASVKYYAGNILISASLHCLSQAVKSSADSVASKSLILLGRPGSRPRLLERLEAQSHLT
jgi:hypothetical protein